VLCRLLRPRLYYIEHAGQLYGFLSACVFVVRLFVCMYKCHIVAGPATHVLQHLLLDGAVGELSNAVMWEAVSCAPSHTVMQEGVPY